MDLFSHQYESLLDYARSVIYKSRLTIDVGDLVNDAYIKFIETGRPFDNNEFKKLISGFGFKETYEQYKRHDLGTPKKQFTSTDQICCNRCHEVKPVNAYTVERRDGGIIIIKKICKDCTNKRRRERYKVSPTMQIYKPRVIPLALQIDKERKRKQTHSGGRKKIYNYDGPSTSKQARKMAYQRWLSKQDKEKLNSYMNSYMKNMLKQQREKLADTYIIRALKQSKKDFSPASIVKKREEILTKRSKRLPRKAA